MERLLRPVTKMSSSMPAAIASSAAYWISGLSTIGSISLGLALVTGKKRVPKPATGNTALVTRFIFLIPDLYEKGKYNNGAAHHVVIFFDHVRRRMPLIIVP